MLNFALAFVAFLLVIIGFIGLHPRNGEAVNAIGAVCLSLGCCILIAIAAIVFRG